MTSEEIKKKIFSPIVGINLLGLLLFATILWFGTQWWMDRFTHHGETIEVPNLEELRTSEAQAILEQLQLKGLVVDSIYDKRKRPGIIMDQKPQAGSRVKSGRTIYLTVNKAAEDNKALPPIINNRNLQQAQQILTQNGFLLGDVEYIPGDKDMVLGVKQNGREVYNGQMVSPERPLTLVVGNNLQESNENNEVYTNGLEDEGSSEWDNIGDRSEEDEYEL